ncbi:MAG: hypothetical protein ACLQGP_07960 [Isosphaeraceae bacterium]
MADHQELKIPRDRQAALGRAIDRSLHDSPLVTARRLVQVYNGGAMPTSSGDVYLTHPVELDGTEAEGGSATANVDTTTTIPVVVLWGAPQSGDILTAYAVGGRWVAERTGSSSQPGYPCGQCQIPRKNLTISWTNLILGNGSTTLVYSDSPTTQWISACTNQLLYELTCTQNQVEFRVYFFLSGYCPSGQSQYCSTIRSTPYSLTQTNLTYSPFLLTCEVTSTACSNLATIGYTGFTVSQ